MDKRKLISLFAGVGLGLSMFLTMEILKPLLTGKEINTAFFIIDIPIFLIIGLIYGYIIYRILKKKDTNSPKT